MILIFINVIQRLASFLSAYGELIKSYYYMSGKSPPVKFKDER